MNNFYKGGRELAYLREILQSIHSIKNRCLVWFTTSYRPIDAKASECNIALEHTAFFVGQHAQLLTNFALTSNFLRVGFGLASTAVRLQRMRSRRGLDENWEKGRSRSVVSEDMVSSKSGSSDRPIYCPSGGRQLSLSGQLRTVFVPASENIRRAKYLLITFQLPFLGQPMFGRCVRGVQGMGEVRSRLEESTNKVRSSTVPIPNQHRAMLCLWPSLHRSWTVHFPSLNREIGSARILQGRCRSSETYKQVRSRLEGSTNPVPRMYCLSTVSSRGRYRKGTRSVLRSYWRGTKEVLRSYWKGTGISMTDVTSGREVGNLNLEVDSVVERTAKARLTTNQACVERMLSVCQAWIVCKTVPVYALSTHYVRLGLASSLLNPYLANALSQIRAFKPFNFFSQVFTHVECDNSLSRLKHVLWRINRSIRDINSEVLVYKVLDTVKVILAPVLAIFQYLYFSSHALKSTRMLLTCIAVFYMFSLSAQTPRKDSGADGLHTVEPILVGNKLPEDFWYQKVKIYNRGDTAIVELSKYKGKSFILDFWSTTCGACIVGFPDLVQLQKQFSDDLNILLVNSYGKKDTYQRIHQMPDDVLRTNNLTSIYADDYLIKLFPHDVYPFYVWVDANERVAAITLKRSVISDHVDVFLKNYYRYDKAN